MTLLLLLLGCPELVSTTDTTDYFPGDEDRDGWTVDEGDCDDNDRAISPGQAETWYDGIDQNCDGNDDDQDGDGSRLDKDCDDADATTFPRAPELCDGVDNDCNEQVDEGAEGGTVAFADEDGDGYARDDARDVTFCDTVPSGYTTEIGDCDDSERSVAPDALETCNGTDDDCDGEVDEDAIDTAAFSPDVDGDGHGAAAGWVRSCERPEGWVDGFDDCDDARFEVNPDADEVCDTVDNDCDGAVDNDAVDAVTVYADTDGDTHGDPATASTACAFSGSLDDTDCDDADATTYAGAPELCDEVDNDCDGVPDDEISDIPYYADSDADGYGAEGDPAGTGCLIPAGFSLTSGDCNDANDDVHPAARELCNDTDDDCDGGVDVDAVDAAPFYMDADADGYGLAAESQILCAADGDYSAILVGDCDDASDSVNPAASEADNDDDDDCDGLIDEDFVAVGDLVITEINRQSWMGGTSLDADAQWFEVYNAGADDLQLDEWMFMRTSSVGTDQFGIDPAQAVVVPAGGLIVLCATDVWTMDSTAASLLVCDYTWGDAALADDLTTDYLDNTYHLQRTEDTVSIWVGGMQVDAVGWDSTWLEGATQSIALSPASWTEVDNDSSTNWCLTAEEFWYSDSGGAVEYGTPGWSDEDCP